MRMGRMVLGLAALALCAPALGQSPAMVSAKNPAGLVTVLETAGYEPTLGTDDQGDPQIDLNLGGYNAVMYFYGCDEKTHRGCDSVQLRVGFDRKAAWTGAAALKLAQTYRFMAVFLDEEGDPWVNWDIVTGDGIPAAVFLLGVGKFADVLDTAGEEIFAD